jgi:hypothetical protein
MQKRIRVLYSPIFYGFIAGFLAVIAQPIFRIQPPQAYGICIVCHARDLINWIINRIFTSDFDIAEVSINFPLLTTIGIIIGAFISSKSNKEFRLIKTENPIIMFLLGALIVNFGLVIMSCPTRLVLRFSFGDPFAFLALIGLFLGIYLGVAFLRWRSKC